MMGVLNKKQAPRVSEELLTRPPGRSEGLPYNHYPQPPGPWEGRHRPIRKAAVYDRGLYPAAVSA